MPRSQPPDAFDTPWGTAGVLRAGAGAGTGAGTAAGVAGPADGKVPVTVEAPPLLALSVGMAGASRPVAVMPATMATNAPADSVPATILDRRAGDCRRRGSVVGIMVGLLRLVVIVP